jgi:hypothetical protein
MGRLYLKLPDAQSKCQSRLTKIVVVLRSEKSQVVMACTAHLTGDRPKSAA